MHMTAGLLHIMKRDVLYIPPPAMRRTTISAATQEHVGTKW